MTANETLHAGREVLDPTMRRYGFRWFPGQSGSSSGGDFASGEYAKGSRRLELHFRHSLGLVTYHIGGVSVSHVDYMRVVLGKEGGNQYPGFSDDALDGFRHLRDDLECHCDAFLTASDEEFRRIAQEAIDAARVSAKRRLP